MQYIVLTSTAYNTWYCPMVTKRATDRERRSLASVIRWEAVFQRGRKIKKDLLSTQLLNTT